ncbi:hypothetical protein [Mycobacterium kansasii]|uniref:hypothetical protein n=1 Tax=Mycobacterium kansasii TaxID=1768 RepID=UPI0009EF7FCA|nr:hypothetical protein [Mycobacterium kansasii]ARG54893.1 hypothetical protein B1T43_02315 [Mycobacterium kansasii]ARG77329.1 hypothetical protein B1T51_25925 [Mycobacterium kansasii]ARG82864.1 hypothetical protein B1T52_26325 [Mycobacterium kansasii]
MLLRRTFRDGPKVRNETVANLSMLPIHHRLSERVKAHVLICLLACYVTWHLRKAWAPPTCTDEHPPIAMST